MLGTHYVRVWQVAQLEPLAHPTPVATNLSGFVSGGHNIIACDQGSDPSMPALKTDRASRQAEAAQQEPCRVQRTFLPFYLLPWQLGIFLHYLR